MSGKHAKITMIEGPLLPILVRVAVPITFANLFQAGYDIVNAFWVGRLTLMVPTRRRLAGLPIHPWLADLTAVR